MTDFVTVCCVCGKELSRKQIDGRKEAVLYSHGYCPVCELGAKAELAALREKIARGEISL
jgi:hypothetical protein